MLKKFIIYSAITLLCIPAFAQDDVTISRRSLPTENELPKTTFSIDPMGFFMLGPQLSGELRIGRSKGYISPHIRYGYLGLLTHLSFATEGIKTNVSPLNYGIGLSYKSFVTNDNNSNLLYLGGGLEYNAGMAVYDKGDNLLESNNDVQGVAVAFHFGYRWRALENRFLGIGLQAGINYFLENESYYVSDNELIDSSTGNALLFGVLQLTYGWEKY